ncbi:hypothetical protein [Mangrovibacterium marinum]|uniref:Outer membrane protein with beta-barrel domain n=1 Tax=Mangrovibacterium marinum TaxID=1639118 RepID=A0A2T5BXS1_9BACT|nr:hypothetical protein [Mangrovibacterium marinum]PTN05948.1 hypothetical protein C8N47_12411 [Mangrovibacterium marinum]
MKTTLLLCLSFLILSLPLWAEENSKYADREARRVQKEEQIRRKWANLIPKQNKLQFAGSMGMFSGSVGWYYGKKNQWETDLFLGFIPKMNRQDGHVTITLKETYTPWRLSINDDFSFEPLTTGAYLNKIFGEYFWNKLPERYPNGYYFWAVNTRFNIFVGQAITLKLDKSPLFGKELSFYYEISTNDLYVISAIGNQTIHAWDIIGLSLGIRYRVF